MKSPALAAWRRELARGARMARAFDWLWRAACWEASAIDAESAGAATTARRCRYRAREIVAAAAQSAA